MTTDTDHKFEVVTDFVRDEAGNVVLNKHGAPVTRDYLDPILNQQVEAMIAVTANRVGRRFYQFAPADDIAQELRTWALKSPKKITRWANDNDDKDFQRILGSVLHDEATHYGRKLKAGALGYRLGDEFYYTKSLIVGCLDAVYDPEKWERPPVKYDGNRSGGDPAHGFNWQATLADVSRAVSKVLPEHRQIIEAKFKLGLSLRQIAAGEGVSLTTAQRRYDQAIKHVWFVLGGPKWMSASEDRLTDEDDGRDEAGRWPAGRRAMSNAHARAVTAREGGFADEFQGGF